MDNCIHVLDHGLVRLVSYMQPVSNNPMLAHPRDGFSSGWTGDLEVVRNARVSYDADWRTGEDEGKDDGLLDYMYRNHHTSPFEAMVFTFEVKAPIFVFRQWHRHRTWSFNEVSARYSELPEEFYVPKPENIGIQSKDNKQMREIVEQPEAQKILAGLWANEMDSSNKRAFMVYKGMLAGGVPRELARSVLPVSTYSRMFATVDLNNLFKFITLRLHEHSQYEIRVYAEALLELIKPVVPVAVAKFKKYNQELFK